MRILALVLALCVPLGAQAATSRSYSTTTGGKVYWADDASGGATNATNFPFTVMGWWYDVTDPGSGSAEAHLAMGMSPEDWTNSFMYVAVGEYADRVKFYTEDPAESKSCHVQVDAASDTLNDWVAWGGRIDSSDCYIYQRNYDDQNDASNSVAHTITGLQGIQHTGWCCKRGADYGTGTGIGGLQAGLAWWDAFLTSRHVSDYAHGLPPMFIEPNNLTGAQMSWGETSDTDTMVDQSPQGNHYDEQNTGAEQVFLVDNTDGPPWFWPMGGN